MHGGREPGTGGGGSEKGRCAHVMICLTGAGAGAKERARRMYAVVVPCR